MKKLLATTNFYFESFDKSLKKMTRCNSGVTFINMTNGKMIATAEYTVRDLNGYSVFKSEYGDHSLQNLQFVLSNLYKGEYKHR